MLKGRCPYHLGKVKSARFLAYGLSLPPYTFLVVLRRFITLDFRSPVRWGLAANLHPTPIIK